VLFQQLPRKLANLPELLLLVFQQEAAHTPAALQGSPQLRVLPLQDQHLWVHRATAEA